MATLKGLKLQTAPSLVVVTSADVAETCFPLVWNWLESAEVSVTVLVAMEDTFAGVTVLFAVPNPPSEEFVPIVLASIVVSTVVENTVPPPFVTVATEIVLASDCDVA